MDTNIKGTLNVLQAARDLGTQRLMVTSTSEVYGTAPVSYTHLDVYKRQPVHCKNDAPQLVEKALLFRQTAARLVFKKSVLFPDG